MKSCETAVIIAGGQSSRMGEDKALLPFGDAKTLTEFQYKKLKQLFAHVYISSKKDKFNFDAKLIYDRYEDASPLVAIISIFETLDDVESVFILSVDAPFVGKKTISSLREEEKQKFDAIIAKSPSGVQPLCGIYKRSILPYAKKQYQKGNHRLRDLLKEANTHTLTFTDNADFTNINQQDEYKNALKKSLTWVDL